VQRCESKAIYGGDKGSSSSTTVHAGEKWETIRDYEVCTQAVEVKPGDVIVVEALYDLKAHKL
jgi:hypothetical protein